jgi:LCP family protein required for cell wall assembly
MRLLARIYLVFVILFIASAILGCGVPGNVVMPAAMLDTNPTASPTYVLAGPDATATATPFQPLDPTAAFLPTNTPPPTFTPFPTFTPTETPTPTVTPFVLDDGTELEPPEHQINIILLGTDTRRWVKKARTDVIILVTLNYQLGRVNVTSFPRDLYIDIPGQGMNRINTANVYGGYPLVKKTFKQNFGIKIDHYILVNFKSFKQIIDGMGGLTVNVGEKLADYRAGYWTKIPKGEVHMDADTVLWYVRSRKTTNDLARNRRQQEVLVAIGNKLLSADAIKNAPKMYDAYDHNVITDIGMFDVIKWIPLAVKLINNPEINHYFISYKQVYDSITPGGAMVLIPIKEKLMKVIRQSQNIK